jgi:antitoxin ParD1/3/4
MIGQIGDRKMTSNPYNCPMPKITLSIPSALKSWIDSRVAEGCFDNASDYICDLVRRDQQTTNDENLWLRGLIEEGLASGVVDKDPKEIIREIMAERPARVG